MWLTMKGRRQAKEKTEDDVAAALPEQMLLVFQEGNRLPLCTRFGLQRGS